MQSISTTPILSIDVALHPVAFIHGKPCDATSDDVDTPLPSILIWHVQDARQEDLPGRPLDRTCKHTRQVAMRHRRRIEEAHLADLLVRLHDADAKDLDKFNQVHNDATQLHSRLRKVARKGRYDAQARRLIEVHANFKNARKIELVMEQLHDLTDARDERMYTKLHNISLPLIHKLKKSGHRDQYEEQADRLLALQEKFLESCAKKAIAAVLAEEAMAAYAKRQQSLDAKARFDSVRTVFSSSATTTTLRKTSIPAINNNKSSILSKVAFFESAARVVSA